MDDELVGCCSSLRIGVVAMEVILDDAVERHESSFKDASVMAQSTRTIRSLERLTSTLMCPKILVKSFPDTLA